MADLTIITPKLSKLIPMLSTDHDGEVVATVRAIDRTLKGAGLDFHALVEALQPASPPTYSPPPRPEPKAETMTMREMALWCRGKDAGDLTEKERKFVWDILDELGELDAKEAGATAYLLVNGQGKGRATRDAEVKTRSEWRIMLLSSGEIGLGDKIAETGKRAKAGQLIRLVDVPADAGKGLGLFEDTKGFAPADFSKVAKTASQNFYGAAGRHFIEALAKDVDASTETARTWVSRVQQDLLAGIGETGGQAYRVAHRFALIAVAGEMARTALDLPWVFGSAWTGLCPLGRIGPFNSLCRRWRRLLTQ
ncbi:DUF927 domain-containing protein [Microvirga pudoricolor]|uniref:DUF927 domain-containing protein n=1 Tax=Microvirga pudoricolor TaxID=2778729 RepID=UPI00194FACB9|nr:DUF927 domain-containing protein [Microvirga pudoricolor]MBM6593740.1 DUF927 domain-containing protein [Microvirga pudoricolor]